MNNQVSVVQTREIVKKFLTHKHPANPNHFDMRGNSALKFAAEFSTPEIVEVLLSYATPDDLINVWIQRYLTISNVRKLVICICSQLVPPINFPDEDFKLRTGREHLRRTVRTLLIWQHSFKQGQKSAKCK